MPDGFHTHSDWFWSRRHDGAVVIQKRTVNGNVAEEHVLSASEWASVVATVSLQGEDADTHQRALALHMAPRP